MNSGLEEIRVIGNVIRDTKGTPFWAGAGAVFQNPSGTVQDNYIRDLEYAFNRVWGTEGCAGSVLAAGYAEWDVQGLVIGNTITGVRVHGNHATGCVNGFAAHGGLTFSSGATVESNRIHRVAVAYNRFVNTENGINVLGGFGLEVDSARGNYFPPDSTIALNLPSHVRGNLVSDLVLRGNTIRQNIRGLSFLGGSSLESPDIVSSNQIRNVAFRNNRLIGNQTDCTVVDEVLIDTQGRGGLVFENRAEVVCE